MIYCKQYLLLMSPNVCFRMDEDDKWELREHVVKQRMLLQDWLKAAVREKIERENSG